MEFDKVYTRTSERLWDAMFKCGYIAYIDGTVKNRRGGVLSVYKRNGRPILRIESIRYFVHHVVWAYHSGPIPAGMVVHHIDEDTNNNCLYNLELRDRSEHATYHKTGKPNPSQAVRMKGNSYARGKSRFDLIGSNNRFAILKESDIVEIRERYEKGDKSRKQLAELFNCHIKTMSSIIRGDSWTYLKGGKKYREGSLDGEGAEP